MEINIFTALEKDFMNVSERKVPPIEQPENLKGAQVWDIRSLGFSWFLHHKVFLGKWYGGKNINLLFKFLRELSRI